MYFTCCFGPASLRVLLSHMRLGGQHSRSPPSPLHSCGRSSSLQGIHFSIFLEEQEPGSPSTKPIPVLAVRNRERRGSHSSVQLYAPPSSITSFTLPDQSPTQQMVAMGVGDCKVLVEWQLREPDGKTRMRQRWRAGRSYPH